MLQEREFERLGSSRTIRSDVRVIAATNCNLRRMVREGKFRLGVPRSTLFYKMRRLGIGQPASEAATA